MGVGNVMRTAVSGMHAQSNKLSSVADNIANADTVGYKRAETEFSSRIPQSVTGEYVSGGVDTRNTRSVTEQGSLQYTDSVTDLAVRGKGFFVVENASQERFLTRAGAFVPDADGFLVNAAGFYLLGYDISNGATATTTANGFAGLTRVRVTDATLDARPSELGELLTNLPSNATAVAAGSRPSDNLATSEFTSKTSLVTYDNLGNQQLIDVYYTKTADHTWEVSVFSQADAGPTGGFPYSSAPLTTTTLSFDATTGQLTGGSASSFSVAIPNGAALNVDLAGTTQFAADFMVFEANVDGNGASGFDILEIAQDGTMYGAYADAPRVAVFRIPLADVPSPDNLRMLPGDVFMPVDTSGDILVGFATESDRGDIISGAKEQSTVDLATELTSMIEAQRGYQANSKVFQAGSELMDVVVNLKR